MIQNVELVGGWDASIQELADRPDDVARRHVAAGIIVFAASSPHQPGDLFGRKQLRLRMQSVARVQFPRRFLERTIATWPGKFSMPLAGLRSG